MVVPRMNRETSTCWWSGTRILNSDFQSHGLAKYRKDSPGQVRHKAHVPLSQPRSRDSTRGKRPSDGGHCTRGTHGRLLFNAAIHRTASTRQMPVRIHRGFTQHAASTTIIYHQIFQSANRLRYILEVKKRSTQSPV